MGWIQLAIAAVTLIFKFLDRWFDMDKERRAQKKEILKEATDAVKNRDASAYNLSINRLKRL